MKYALIIMYMNAWNNPVIHDAYLFPDKQACTIAAEGLKAQRPVATYICVEQKSEDTCKQ